MSELMPTREAALLLLKEYTKSDSLIKHALSVEAVMRHFAKLFDESDIEKWGIIGLLHDIDYELYPEEHCIKARDILKSKNYPESYIHAVECHGYGICTNVEPVETMEKVLYTIDELTGLITATVLMRPSKSILDLEVKSVKKKWKQKSFAAGVDRDLIEKGAKRLGIEMDKVIEETINGMKAAAEEIGLAGAQ
ncbi:HD domain-containing protein [Clostridium omnivorum]|uniref:HDIG domain-containing protein n=1 Tax=Clostridium omnivorum TaxID=1604902 RepID=A0ABQ5N5D8_9CLOT|nr:HD domain-containing protein [Clostridium sp. E14]GLC30416.1 HDIG domain-containing protein [Clostridium sp. E14]